MKLFVSYARVDKPLCKIIVDRLTNVHDVWYDARLFASQDWWEEIQNRIEWCDGFVYLLSPESVKSEYCQREYEIASNHGKHIFPVLIQARTEIPRAFSNLQYANLSEGMDEMHVLTDALHLAEIHMLRGNIPAKTRSAVVQKPDPNPKPVQKPAEKETVGEMIGKAADAMDNGDFDGAVFTLKQALEKNPTGNRKRLIERMLKEAEAELERQAYLRAAQHEYAPIVEVVKRERTRDLGCEEFAEFRKDYPDYDPEKLADLCARSGAAQITTASAGSDILPAPFAWVDIPAVRGIVLPTHENDSPDPVDLPAYKIAKYPVTNAQFAKFIEAGGYNERKWWTDAGWKACEEGWHYDGGWKPSGTAWTQPRYWNDDKWKGAEQPVVGVSWYEAVAFCLWLREVTGENVMLPAEDQWQYAAQGDDGRKYPWGNDWDCGRCNNSVDPCSSGVTTSVREYEGKGDSFFDVVDMAGNVWEWCLTDYENQSNNFNRDANSRVLRGGSWGINYTYGFLRRVRDGYVPRNGLGNVGFRLALS